LKRARSFAAQQGTTVSAMLASELRRIVETQEAYAQAKSRALAQLDSPFQLGGRGIRSREDPHDRHDLR
jgi:hydroxymethylpyrimidine/phosphomethylpyrimidine kinase